ncbi:MAG: GNAT family N-acetyltransferase [Rhodospirillales bacterium]|nr:GNAT family N-acetyltransferase [Rhodospirillales bacterium]
MGGGEDHPLDNVVWTALTTMHASIALGSGFARHYPRDMAPFSAVAAPTARAYADLAESLGPEIEARLFRPREEPAPPGWETLSARPIIQMIADAPGPSSGNAHGISIDPLTIDAASDMLALAEAAKPGPFSARTMLLGNYVGVRESVNGRLIAMAGERFRLPGYVELSGICVHPDARGCGLGRTLTQHLMQKAFDRREVPFLHVFPDNPAAALYARGGFRERARLWVIWRRPAPIIRSVGA